MTRLKKYAIDKYKAICRDAGKIRLADTFAQLDQLANLLDEKDQIEIVNKVLNSEI